ncbi:RNA polymerase-binding transcription factor DksA [Diaminobutyricimonas aerilata]|uniref:RNA polymerase-binding transcription factor DksA n=1 Tax=Diaminobutyricimonas aerilata TaxID=1162967 RepID=A0A2M9CHW7_9MICO|nr:TraR/DksA C4-type zinc finger protein [Diaminobutyricimonas aerilata]PJJ71516.1 RNA polymerase-binding transcription factor DksA [Diaminobutyricimonas aerilata]
MEPAAEEEFAALLRARSVELQRSAAAAAADLDGIRSARSAATADDEHDPEGSTLAADWSRTVALSGAAAAELREVEAALGRLEAGDYGRCESCGVAIPVERLRIRPAATRCVTCAAQHPAR